MSNIDIIRDLEKAWDRAEVGTPSKGDLTISRRSRSEDYVVRRTETDLLRGDATTRILERSTDIRGRVVIAEHQDFPHEGRMTFWRTPSDSDYEWEAETCWADDADLIDPSIVPIHVSESMVKALESARGSTTREILEAALVVAE